MWLDIVLKPEGQGESWHLRCTRLEPAKERLRLPKPLVGCRFVDLNPMTDIGFVAGSFGLERMLYLDSVPGLQVHATHGGFGDSEQVELVPGGKQ